jgi:hypothetical protein
MPVVFFIISRGHLIGRSAAGNQAVAGRLASPILGTHLHLHCTTRWSALRPAGWSISTSCSRTMAWTLRLIDTVRAESCFGRRSRSMELDAYQRDGLGSDGAAQTRGVVIAINRRGSFGRSTPRCSVFRGLAVLLVLAGRLLAVYANVWARGITAFVAGFTLFHGSRVTVTTARCSWGGILRLRSDCMKVLRLLHTDVRAVAFRCHPGRVVRRWQMRHLRVPVVEGMASSGRRSRRPTFFSTSRTAGRRRRPGTISWFRTS